jgi:hypothetical protein
LWTIGIRPKQEGAIRRHGERAVPRWVHDDVRHRSKAKRVLRGVTPRQGPGHPQGCLPLPMPALR